VIDFEDDGRYQPGVCNIGPAEIAHRRQVGYAGLAGAVALAVLLRLVHAPAWLRLSVALPAAVSISGFMQARSRFCAGFGMAGLRNFGDLGEEVRVADPEARAADRRRSLKMNAAATAGGLAVGIASALLPD
jgi:hypothetical protein